MDFQTSVKTCFKKYATFSGRASRSEFWYFYLFNYGLYVILIISALKISFIFFWFFVGFLLATLIPFIAVIICFAVKNLCENINHANFLSKIILIIGLIILISQVYIIEIINQNSAYWETWQNKRLSQASSDTGIFGFVFE